MGHRLLEVFGLSGDKSTGERLDSELQPTVTQEDNESRAGNDEGQMEDPPRNAEDQERPFTSPAPSEDFDRTISASNVDDPSPPAAEHDLISSSSEELSPDPEDPVADSAPVRVSNRRRDTDTVTMEVEISGRPPNVQLRGRPVFTDAPSAEALSTGQTSTQNESLAHQQRHNAQQVDSEEPKHRVTLLSGYIADMLASHLAQLFSEILCLPLQAHLARAVALGFLATARPTSSVRTSALGLPKAVYPVDAWFGFGLRGAGWRGVGDYAAKMILCSAVEAAVGYGVWQVGATTCFWAGRRWFEWGRL